MWTLNIIFVLGNNYESSVGSTFSEEVRFGSVFTHNQKIIPCMKTTDVSVKDVIWRLSSKLSQSSPWKRPVSTRRKVKLRTLITCCCPVLRFPLFFFPIRHLVAEFLVSHWWAEAVSSQQGPAGGLSTHWEPGWSFFCGFGGRGMIVALCSKGICHFSLLQSSPNKELWDKLNLWYMLMYWQSTRFG